MEAVNGGWWEAYGNVAFYACATAAVMFVLMYLVITPWWRTEAGRNIMAVMGTLAVAMAYFGWVISQGGVPDGFWPIRAILFTCMFLSIAWRVVMLIRAQLLARKENR